MLIVWKLQCIFLGWCCGKVAGLLVDMKRAERWPVGDRQGMQIKGDEEETIQFTEGGTSGVRNRRQALKKEEAESGIVPECSCVQTNTGATYWQPPTAHDRRSFRPFPELLHTSHQTNSLRSSKVSKTRAHSLCVPVCVRGRETVEDFRNTSLLHAWLLRILLLYQFHSFPAIFYWCTCPSLAMQPCLINKTHGLDSLRCQTPCFINYESVNCKCLPGKNGAYFSRPTWSWLNVLLFSSLLFSSLLSLSLSSLLFSSPLLSSPLLSSPLLSSPLLSSPLLSSPLLSSPLLRYWWVCGRLCGVW